MSRYLGDSLTYLPTLKTFFQNVIEPLAPPPAIPLLVMIRLNDAVLAEIESRGCLPLEPVCTSLKLAMWPIFRKEMDAHIDSVKRMADAAGGSGLGAMLTKAVKDSVVREVCFIVNFVRILRP
jgi:vacuolar protein sorting-associated protein 52